MKEDAQTASAAVDAVAVEEDPTAEQAEPLQVHQEARRLVTQPYDLAVQTLVENVRSKKLLMTDVPYQRGYVWDDPKASRLIESLLLNVPIPVCYFAENPDGTLEVIDGQQRIRSIQRFLDDDFPLHGIPVLTELDGKRFSELPERDQRRIGNRTIRCIVITEESHPDIKFDVFERLNTGSVTLTAQELRNCIYRGAFNDGLRTIANDKGFLETLGRSASKDGRSDRDTRMEEEELILRFLALMDELKGYQPPLRQFLNTYMRAHRAEPPKEELVQLFKETCKVVVAVFDGGAFYGRNSDGSPTRTINKALFDAVMVSLAKADQAKVVDKAKDVRKALEQLLADDKFQSMVGRATADKTRMLGRIGAFSDRLRHLGIKVGE